MRAEIEIPYNLTVSAMRAEPGTEDSVLEDELRRLMEMTSDSPWMNADEDIMRVLQAAVCLKAHQPDLSTATCIHTAIIWERG